MTPNVDPIPKGFHTISAHLVVRDAVRAIEFYKKAFGAEESYRMPGPDGRTIMHALLRIGDSSLMLGDEFPDMGAKSPQTYGGSPVTIHLYVRDADAAFKRAVTAGATVRMPLADMFWGDRYGRLADPFGHEWSVATHTRDVPPQEMTKAAAAMCGGKKT